MKIKGKERDDNKCVVVLRGNFRRNNTRVIVLVEGSLIMCIIIFPVDIIHRK